MIIATVTSLSAYAAEANALMIDAQNNIGSERLIIEDNTVTNEDMQTHFAHYAENDATVDISDRINTVHLNEPANVVGVVIDHETDELIAGAKVIINGDYIVTTGSDGRFQIRNLSSDTYDWSIEAPGYCKASYLNYEVDHYGGTNIFTFEISKNKSLVKDRVDVMARRSGNGLEAATSTSVSDAINATASFNPSARLNVKVASYSSGWTSTYSMNRFNYIVGIISGELSPPRYFINEGLTENQVWQLYVAEGIAANSYLEYCMSVEPRHTTIPVCDSGNCCQNYDGTAKNELMLDAASLIVQSLPIGGYSSEILFYSPSNNQLDYMLAAHFACCNNKGTYDWPGQPALRRVENCTDLVQTTPLSRGYGMCQMGAAYLAKTGYNAMDILHYYYTDVVNKGCSLYDNDPNTDASVKS